MDTHTTALVPASSPGMDLRAYCDHASKLRESSDIAKIAHALVQAQKALANPPRNRTVKVRTKTGGEYVFRYATLDQIMDAARPALGEAGLCVLQPIVSTEKGPVLVTRLLHESGQWMECEIPLPRLGESLQDFGSAVSYVRRYAVSAMLNITADEDDDGNTAAGNHVADAPRRGEGQRGPARPASASGQAGAAAGAGKQGPAPQQGRAGSGDERPDGTARALSSRTRVTGGEDGNAAQATTGAGASSPQALRDDTRPGNGSASNGVASSNGGNARQPPRAGKTQPAADAPRRPKDEAAPPSVWGILRPGKTSITAPDGTAWLNWWTGRASKATAEGKRDELRTLYEANTAGWDQIALGSAEGHDVVAEAAKAVRAALDG